MFRAIILPIFRSNRLCHSLWYNAPTMLPACGRPATSWVHYTTSCNTQSCVLEDGQNKCPKHVELTGIINKPLLLHLLRCLYYCTINQVPVKNTLFTTNHTQRVTTKNYSNLEICRPPCSLYTSHLVRGGS